VSRTIYFASDIHGSDVCWRKFLNAAKFYGADILVMGGDVSGKAVVPIVARAGGHVAAEITGDRVLGTAELDQVEARIRDMGFYPFRTTDEELDQIWRDRDAVHRVFLELMRDSLDRWMAWAEQKLAGTGVQLFVMTGNDDPPELREQIRAAASPLIDPEDELIDLGEGFAMISCGWSNRTPWDSPREMDEDELERHIEKLASVVPDPARAVFNLHVPPAGTAIDQAPVLDGSLKPTVKGGAVLMESVGSVAVRHVIERHQPLLSLHGHIHESRGAIKIGRTLCVNPGSEYADGILLGALIELDARKGIKSYQLPSG
jgi:Icc-related predicted phosphoesterase